MKSSVHLSAETHASPVSSASHFCNFQQYDDRKLKKNYFHKDGSLSSRNSI